jgi:hypothetical protein
MAVHRSEAMINLEKMSPDTGVEEFSLADTNFRNTVIYYREELLRIDEGELATEQLKDRQRRALVKAGVLRRVYGRGGCRLKLSNEARRLLGELGELPRILS